VPREIEITIDDRVIELTVPDNATNKQIQDAISKKFTQKAIPFEPLKLNFDPIKMELGKIESEVSIPDLNKLAKMLAKSVTDSHQVISKSADSNSAMVKTLLLALQDFSSKKSNVIEFPEQQAWSGDITVSRDKNGNMTKFRCEPD